MTPINAATREPIESAIIGGTAGALTSNNTATITTIIITIDTIRTTTTTISVTIKIINDTGEVVSGLK